MVSPGELRLVSAIYNHSQDVIKPKLDGNHTVSYPFAEKAVDEQELPIVNTLDSLAQKGIFEKEYIRKAYICPACGLERMSYSRACPECRSIHTTGRIVAQHLECGHFGPAFEFQQKNGTQLCQGCNSIIERSELEYDEKHVCKDCKESFSQPKHQVQCRVCLATFSPKQVSERLLYEYTLTDNGRAWYHIHTMTINQIIDRLEENGYAVRSDVSISNDSETWPIHVYGKHTTSNARMIAGIFDDVQCSDLDYLQTVADFVNSQILIVTTNRYVSDSVYKEIRDRQINLLAVQEDGSLNDNYSVYKDPSDPIARV